MKIDVTNCSIIPLKPDRIAILNILHRNLNQRQNLDDFCAIINNTKKVKDEFTYTCDSIGTSNVILKGFLEQ